MKRFSIEKTGVVSYICIMYICIQSCVHSRSHGFTVLKKKRKKNMNLRT